MKVLNIFAVGLALVLSVNAQAETKIKVLKSFELVGQESYGDGISTEISQEPFVTLKVNVLEVETGEATSCDYGVEQAECAPSVVTEERISFNSCSYEAGERKACTLLGAKDGYEPSVAKEKLYNYDEEKNSEWVTTGVLGAVVTAVGVVRWKGMRSRQIKRFQSGKSFFSGLGDTHLYGSNLPAMRRDHLVTYGYLLAGLVGGKMLFIDDAGDNENEISGYQGFMRGESIVVGDQVVVFEDFDAEKMINKLSRALLQ